MSLLPPDIKSPITSQPQTLQEVINRLSQNSEFARLLADYDSTQAVNHTLQALGELALLPDADQVILAVKRSVNPEDFITWANTLLNPPPNES